MTSDHNPIDPDKVAINPGLLPYAHTIGGVVIRPEDVGKAKGKALAAMQQQTDRQLGQIRQQIELLARQVEQIERRKQVSVLIYAAEMGFEPLVGHTYNLYRKADGKLVLSMVGPNEWRGRCPYETHVAQAALLADHTWDIIDG